ncbi:hypothetical protein [Novosphingobium sp. AAP93]|nr:hypothetical protein [Novosphingobium sp. AAP93]
MHNLTQPADKSGLAALIGTGLGLFAMTAVAVGGAITGVAMMMY